MPKPSPMVDRAQEFLSRKSGQEVRSESARQAAEGLLCYFRLLMEWEEKARSIGREFENGKVRGVAAVPCPAYPSAATGPGRA